MTFRRTLALSLALVTFCLTLAADGLFMQTQGKSSLENYTFQSQLHLPASTMEMPQDAVIQASGSSFYPVTPGDIYSLTYYDGREPVTQLIAIDSDYNAAIASIGNLNAKGMKLIEFKRRVESLVSTYYQYSVPQLSLKQCGVFSVRVSGDVKYASYVTVWGLSRLSDLAQFANNTASTRVVNVVGPDGKSTNYDLYNGLINGSEEDNPLLAPGEEVVFQKATTTVSIDGSVASSGVYQPKEGETLKDLLESYAGGAKANADLSSVIVANYENGSYQAKALSAEEADSYILKDGDMVEVKTIAKAQSYVTVEGAVKGIDDKDTGRFFYSFSPAETAEEVLVKIASSFLGSSDPSGIYIDRNGEKIAFDSAAALAGAPTTATPLQLGDVIVVPFSQKLVTVTGAVNKPGTFTYIPDRTTDYYINMAGGYTIDAKKLSQRVEDKNGEKLKHLEYVPAESTITVPVSNFRTDLATTATIVSIASTILGIIVTTTGLIGK